MAKTGGAVALRREEEILTLVEDDPPLFVRPGDPEYRKMIQADPTIVIFAPYTPSAPPLGLLLAQAGRSSEVVVVRSTSLPLDLSRLSGNQVRCAAAAAAAAAFAGEPGRKGIHLPDNACQSSTDRYGQSQGPSHTYVRVLRILPQLRRGLFKWCLIRPSPPAPIPSAASHGQLLCSARLGHGVRGSDREGAGHVRGCGSTEKATDEGFPVDA
ncbi:hypothetical protein CSUB01_06302 [Colletotrichum sublineola]|uniref:Uncharacterized protein n=1 Tax=Colletotrichum sublineola TaxID=1173701 RepID=A0A066XUP0_COLSU|nr:hypothetical protein CSUB01_06302 [Colletotrichum sublineola]